MRTIAAGSRGIALFALFTVFATFVLLAPPVFAEPPPPAPAPTIETSFGSASLHGVSLWGILPWGGIGAGARFMKPLSIRPLLVGSRVHDSFALEGGADLMHWSYAYTPVPGGSYGWTQIVPVIGVMWNVWFTDAFALYPKVELGYAFGWYSDWTFNGPRPSYGGLFADATAGALYKLGNGLTLRAELGYGSLKLGAGWLF
jgi:hypothetical protein